MRSHTLTSWETETPTPIGITHTSAMTFIDPPCAIVRGPAFHCKCSVAVFAKTAAPSKPVAQRSIGSLQHVDVFAGAHFLEDRGPDGHADLAQVRFAQQQHERARLPDAAADPPPPPRSLG